MAELATVHASAAALGRRIGLAMLQAIERKLLWLSSWTIHNANHLRPSRDKLKVGGHQASCASVASIMTALYFDVLRPGDRVAVKPHASPIYHAAMHLLGREPIEQLQNFRALGGAQSYPSRTKDKCGVDFSTGSVGLGAAMTLFASLTQDYVRAARAGARPTQPPGRMVAIVGDAELDEGNIYEALLEGWKHDVRNLWWVIDYNRQSLDRVVPELLFAKIEQFFATVGWRVVTIKYGKKLQAAFARPGGEALARLDRRLPERPLRRLVLQGRRRLAGASGERSRPQRRRSAPLLDGHDDDGAGRADDQSRRARSGGPARGLPRRRRRPAALLHRLHRQGLGPAVRRPQGQSCRADDPGADGGAAARARRPRRARSGRTDAGLDVPPERLRRLPGRGAVPQPRRAPRRGAGRRCPATLPQGRRGEHGLDPGGVRADHGRARAQRPAAGRAHRHHLARRHGLDQPRRLGRPARACSAAASTRTCSAPSRCCRRRPGARAATGQHLELGIAENNLFLNLASLGLAHELFGARLLPVGTLYDPFIARGLDALNYACYQDARFLLVATPSGITLAPEGGAHQSIGTPADRHQPAGPDLVRAGLRRRGRGDAALGVRAPAGAGRRLGLSAAEHPPDPPARARDDAGAERRRSWPAATGCCRPSPAPSWRIVCTGAVAPEALKALAAVREDIPGAGLLHVTSADLLDADWRRRGRAGTAARPAGAAGAGRGAGHRARRPPGDAVVAGRRARPSRQGAGRRPLRPVRRPDRPLPRPRARRRRHPGACAAALLRR